MYNNPIQKSALNGCFQPNQSAFSVYRCFSALPPHFVSVSCSKVSRVSVAAHLFSPIQQQGNCAKRNGKSQLDQNILNDRCDG